MSNTVPVPGQIERHLDDKGFGDVTGIIGLSGEGINGTLLVSFERACILDLVSKMLMEEFTEISADVVDAVGEITNMICGGVKKELSEQGIMIHMARPIMITGKGYQVAQHHHAESLRIPFTTPAGNFVVETCMNGKTVG